MKRYDIDIEDSGGSWLSKPRLDITEQEDGEWVRWEDVLPIKRQLSTEKRMSEYWRQKCGYVTRWINKRRVRNEIMYSASSREANS